MRSSEENFKNLVADSMVKSKRGLKRIRKKVLVVVKTFLRWNYKTLIKNVRYIRKRLITLKKD